MKRWEAILETTGFQAIKLAVMGLTGLSRDSLHLHIGLLTMVLAAVVSRRTLASPLPWLAVLAVACLAEAWDLRDDFAGRGSLRWGASLHDLVNTLFWPTILLLLARSGALGFRSVTRK
jgi:hypothetical protein